VRPSPQSLPEERAMPRFRLTVACLLAALAVSARGAEPAPVLPARVDRHGDPLPPRALARLGTVRFRQSAFVMSVAYSPDGKMLALGGAGQGLGLWDAATGKPIRQFDAPDRQPSAIIFSPDGKLLAATRGRGAVWDVASGKKVRDLPGEWVTFAPDGRRVALVGIRNIIRLEDTLSGEEVGKFEGHTAYVNRVAFSPDGRWLASGSHDNTVRLWNVATGKEIRRWTAHTKAVYAVAFSADGKFLASGSEDETVRLWDPVSGKEFRRLEGKGPVHYLSFARRGTMLAAACDTTLRVWDAATGKELRSWQGKGGWVFSPDFSPDGKTLVAATAFESGIRRWDLATGQELPDFGGHRSGVNSLAFAPDGKTIYSTSHDRTVRCWNLSTGRDAFLFDGTAQSSFFLTLTPDRKTLAARGGRDQRFALWDVAGRKPLYQDKGLKMLRVLVFSPDGHTLAGAGEDGVIHFWQVPSVREIGTSQAAPAVQALAFSPDGRVLASGADPVGQNAGSAPTLRLWNVATRKEQLALPYHGSVSCVSFAPDGRTLASGDWMSTDNRVRLWDLATGRQLWGGEGHSDGVSALAFSPDGRLLASGSGSLGTDSAVHLWETISGRGIARFEGHTNGVLALTFSPDGRVLASGGGESQILLWDVTGRLTGNRGTRLSSKQAWETLAAEDAGKAYEAIWSLAAAPEKAVSMLKEHLRPDQAPDPKRVARLLTDLDSDVFKVRSAADDELRRLGDTVEPTLRTTLRNQNSLETRRRLEQILEAIVRSREGLRTVRAVQVLEYAATPEARRLLETLADGLAGTRQTREARTALERLRKNG
jgi:WD40 repeat protein